MHGTSAVEGEKKCCIDYGPHSLNGIEITSRIFIIHVSLLDLLGKLALPFPSFLGTLELQTVLVHGETHGL
jgi:hypothetical protein